MDGEWKNIAYLKQDRRLKGLALAVVVLLLLFSIFGCGVFTSKEGEEFFGRWFLVRIETPDMELGLEDLQELMGEEEEYFVDIKKDGYIELKAPIAGDGIREMEWTVQDDKLICRDENGVEEFVIEDDLLVEKFQDVKIYYEKAV